MGEIPRVWAATLVYLSIAYYRKGFHTKYDMMIHLVFVTKYRKAILKGEIEKRVRRLIREIFLANEVQILKGHVSKDHVQLLLSYPPRLSVSKLTQYIKGKTSRKLLQEYSEIRNKFWGSHVWARGYFAVSTGNMTDKLIAKYIEKQDIEQKDDDFKIGDEL